MKTIEVRPFSSNFGRWKGLISTASLSCTRLLPTKATTITCYIVVGQHPLLSTVRVEIPCFFWNSSCFRMMWIAFIVFKVLFIKVETVNTQTCIELHVSTLRLRGSSYVQEGAYIFSINYSHIRYQMKDLNHYFLMLD